MKSTQREINVKVVSGVVFYLLPNCTVILHWTGHCSTLQRISNPPPPPTTRPISSNCYRIINNKNKLLQRSQNHNQSKATTEIMFRAVFWVVQYAPLKRRSTIILHGSTTQKTALNIILAAVRTWNLTTEILTNGKTTELHVRFQVLTAAGMKFSLLKYISV
jgi:hypothetical protein